VTGFLFSDEAVSIIIFSFFFLSVGTVFVEQRVDSERSSCWVLGIVFSCRLLQDLLACESRLEIPSEACVPPGGHRTFAF